MEKNEIICKRCGKQVKEKMYETGMEAFCKCQCTLDANFDKTLWKKIKKGQ